MLARFRSKLPVRIASRFKDWPSASGCHLSCAIPAAIIKVAEVALELALPQEVHIKFEAC